MFDRLGRRDDETPFVVEWFTKQGVKVWSTQEGEQRFDNHVDKLLNYIRYWQASGESQKTSIRIKTRKEQMVREGLYTGGSVPYGYKIEKRGRVNKKGHEVYDIVVEEEEAKNVRMIFNKITKEGYGSYRIAKMLNENGYRTHHGSKFTTNTILRILQNKLYCGYMIAKDAMSEQLKGLQIIDEETFKQAQYIVEQRQQKRNAERQIALTTRGQTLLSGNVFCGHCGGRMTIKCYRDRYMKKDGTETVVNQMKYECYHKARKLNLCDGQTTYTADRIDETVMSIIKEMLGKIKNAPEEEIVQRRYAQEIAGNVERQKKLNVELKKSETRLNSLKQEIARVLTGESLFKESDLAALINSTEEKMAEIKCELIELQTEQQSKQSAVKMVLPLYNRFVSWADEFENAELERKKMICCQLIKRVEIFKGYKIKIEFNLDYAQFCEEWEKMIDCEQIAG